MVAYIVCWFGVTLQMTQNKNKNIKTAEEKKPPDTESRCGEKRWNMGKNAFNFKRKHLEIRGAFT